jgi:hypothetical protein
MGEKIILLALNFVLTEDMKTYLTLFASITAVLVSVVTSFIALRKYQPEVKNTNAETDKINAETNKIAAETVSAYALELKTLKEEHRVEIMEINAQTARSIASYAQEFKTMKEDRDKERKDTELQLDSMRVEINKLRKEINEINSNQERERSIYRQFINELLMGINRLTGQIQMRGETPVWSPGKPPFDV